jgi:hypothetical protein
MPELRATISADNRPFINVMRQTEHFATDFSHKLTEHFGSIFTGGFIASKLVGFIEEGFKEAANIPKLAEQLGMTNDQIQDVQHAAMLAHVEFTDFSAALVKFGVARKEAFENTEKRDLFNAIFPDERWRKVALEDFDLLIELMNRYNGEQLNKKQRDIYSDLTGTRGTRSAKLAGLSRYLGEPDPHKFTQDELNAIEEADRIYKEKIHALQKGVTKPIAQGIIYDLGFNPRTNPLLGAFVNPLLNANKWISNKIWKGLGGGSDTSARDAETLAEMQRQEASEKAEYERRKQIAKIKESTELYPDKIALNEQKKQKEEILKITEQINRIRFSGLTPLEKEADLERQIAENRAKWAQTKTPHESNLNVLEEQRLQAELDNMRKARGQRALNSLSSRSDSLLAIGNFAGIGNQPWARTEGILAAMATDMKAVKENTKGLTRNTVYLPKQ